jgi:hypothetical protein
MKEKLGAIVVAKLDTIVEAKLDVIVKAKINIIWKPNMVLSGSYNGSKMWYDNGSYSRSKS